MAEHEARIAYLDGVRIARDLMAGVQRVLTDRGTLVVALQESNARPGSLSTSPEP